ncbi:hypothetical protein D3C72_1684980 [compost metagenome]
MSFLTVVLLQALQLARFGELPISRTNRLQRHPIDKRLCRLGNQPLASLGVRRGTGNGHAPAHTVTQHHEITQVELLAQGLKTACGFVLDKPGRQCAWVGRRTPEAQPVIGDDPTPACLGQAFGKVAPQGHATQRVVQQHNGCAVHFDRVPALRVQVAVRS